MDWIGVLAGIVMINILLSGDNALIIALASRQLPQEQRRAVSFWGSFGAIGLRILLTFAAVLLLQVPYLQFVGGIFLSGIAVKLMAQEKETFNLAGQQSVWTAVKTIITADLVMSIDNVVAITGVARGNLGMVAIGLLISIPIIMWGSETIGRLLEKWPVVIMAGAAFLGWTAGEMMIQDPRIHAIVALYPWADWGMPTMIAISVIVIGKWVNENRRYMKN